MKERLLNTRFWSDGWVRKINPLDRYLLLYLLTNEHTNICGIYELSLPVMAFDTGLDERDLEKTMLPRLQPKVYYKDEWIILTNFLKYQRIKSESVMEGVRKSLNQAPKAVISYAKKVGYWDDGGMIWGSSHILEPEPEPEPENNTIRPQSGKKQTTFNPLGGEILNAFTEIDPKNKTYYANKTQRSACDFLLSEYGLDKVLQAIKLLPQINQRKLYIRQITSPYELKENWVKIGNALKQKKEEHRIAFF